MNPILIPKADEKAYGPAVAISSATSQQVPSVRVAAEQILPVGNAGYWECSPGRFRRQVAKAEYSYLISGRGSFTPDGEDPIVFQAGDSVYFPPDTEGEWEIVETVRKAFVILG